MRGIKFVPDGKRLLLGWKLGTNKEVSEREKTLTLPITTHALIKTILFVRSFGSSKACSKFTLLTKDCPKIVQRLSKACSCPSLYSKLVQSLCIFSPKLGQTFVQMFGQNVPIFCPRVSHFFSGACPDCVDVFCPNLVESSSATCPFYSQSFVQSLSEVFTKSSSKVSALVDD